MTGEQTEVSSFVTGEQEEVARMAEGGLDQFLVDLGTTDAKKKITVGQVGAPGYDQADRSKVELHLL